VSATILCLLASATPCWPQSSLDTIKTQYTAVSSQLEKHIDWDFWIDDDPQSPQLLARQWSLAAEWVAAWLNAQPSTGPDDLAKAIAELEPTVKPNFLKLSDDAFLVAAPTLMGNVFIVSKLNGYRVAWSTAQPTDAVGKEADSLAAWFPQNARHGSRGPYWAASGRAGPVTPVEMGRLPSDEKEHARFYIEGVYAQSAGGTEGAQISVWAWDGVTARPLVVRSYAIMIDQRVGTRVEGDLLKVQQKEFFRTFSSCGACEERQTDWILRLTPHGIEDLGEKSTVPELDAVDELFYRVISHQPAQDIAAPGVIKAAEKMVEEAKAQHSAAEWKKYPTLGMMGTWKVDQSRSGSIVCLTLDAIDTITALYTLEQRGDRFFISDLKRTQQECE
jgi:hypothetical protein